MDSEKQYIELYEQTRDMLCQHSAPVLNDLRQQAFEDFCRLGFPTQKVERYSPDITDMQKIRARASRSVAGARNGSASEVRPQTMSASHSGKDIRLVIRKNGGKLLK